MNTSGNSIQFNPRFFQTQIALQYAQESEDTVFICYSPEKYGTWDAFEQHADYANAQQQYQQLFTTINTFAEQYCPHPEQIQTAFSGFLLRFEGEFASRLPLLYGVGKSTFDTFYGLLNNENLPLDRKITALQNLAQELNACAEGAINSLIVLVRQLQCTMMGGLGEALLIKEQMIEQLVREFNAGRSDNPDMEKPAITVYLNFLRQRYGLPLLEGDIHSDQAMLGITRHDLGECLHYVGARLTPERIVSVMADNYLGQLYEILSASSDPLEDEIEEWHIIDRLPAPAMQEEGAVEHVSASEEAEAQYQEHALPSVSGQRKEVSDEELNTCLQTLTLNLTPIYGEIPEPFLFQEMDGQYYATGRNTLIRLALMQTLQRSGVCEAEEVLFSQYTEPDIVLTRRIPDPATGHFIETGEKRIVRGATVGIYRMGTIWWARTQTGTPTLLTLAHLKHLAAEPALPPSILEEAIHNSSADELKEAWPLWIRNIAFFKPYIGFTFKGREEQLNDIILALFRHDLSREETCRIALREAFRRMELEAYLDGWHDVPAPKLFSLLFQMETEPDRYNWQQILLTRVGTERNEQILKNLLLAGMSAEARDVSGNTPLMYVAREGWLGTVSQLGQLDINIDATNSQGRTALMLAAEHGHLSVIDKLYASGANALLACKKGKNVLAYAIIAGHLDVIGYLLTIRQAHARQQWPSPRTWLNGTWSNTWLDINAADINGITPLLWLFHDRSAPGQPPEVTRQVLRLLLAHGADINASIRILAEEKVFSAGCFDLLLDAGIRLPLGDEHICRSILLNTIRHGTLAHLQRLIGLKLPTYYSPDHEQESVIEQAIRYRQLDMALLLLSRHQADISLQTRAGLLFRLAVIEDASISPLQQMLALLLDPAYLRRSDPARDTSPAFFDQCLRFIIHSHWLKQATVLKACQILIRHNVIHLPLQDGDTLLMHLVKKASDYRHERGIGEHFPAMLRYLATHTDFLSAQDHSGFTPFAIACLSGDVEIIEALYRAKPTIIGIRDARGNTPLMLAANSQQTEVINWLLERQPDLNASNNDGYTAFMLARMRGHQAGIKALRNAGADTQEIAEAMPQ